MLRAGLQRFFLHGCPNRESVLPSLFFQKMDVDVSAGPLVVVHQPLDIIDIPDGLVGHGAVGVPQVVNSDWNILFLPGRDDVGVPEAKLLADGQPGFF